MPVQGERRELTRASVFGAPDAPGVYALFEQDELVFYGSAFGGTITIRSCLAEHLSGLRANAGPITHCCWEISIDPAARERQLLDEYRLQHGRLPRGNVQSG